MLISLSNEQALPHKTTCVHIQKDDGKCTEKDVDGYLNELQPKPSLDVSLSNLSSNYRLIVLKMMLLIIL